MRRLSTAVALLGLVLAACGGSGGTEQTTGGTLGSTTTTTALPDGARRVDDFDSGGLSGVRLELAELREANGYVIPLQASLDLFASAFGEVPGADSSRFTVDEHDGSLAMMSLLAHWDDLTTEQRSAAAALLGYEGPAAFTAVATAAGPTALQVRVDSARAAIAARLGEDTPFPIVAEAVPGLTGGRDGRPVLGTAAPERAGMIVASGSPDRCRIRLNPDAGVTDTTIVHEVFHCFQYHLVGDVQRVFSGQDWIVEGSAEWAGAVIGGVDDTAVGHFSEWVLGTGSLFTFDYPAIGFYWVVESMGVDPWTVVRPMLTSDGGESAVAATGLDPAEVLRRMASSVARRSLAPAIDVGDRWDFSAAGVPEEGTRMFGTVSPAAPLERSYFKTVFSRLHPGVLTLEGGQIVEVTAASDVGVLEFFGSAPKTWSGDYFERFCLEEGACSCGGEDSELELVDRKMAIAFGERDGGTLGFTVRVIEIEDAFTDGRWEGTITATPMGISVEEIQARRDEFTAPFELVIEDGQVVGGSYTILAHGQGEGPTGSMTGVGHISGTFHGCGYAPQMIDTGSFWILTAHTSEGDVTIELDLPGGEGPIFPTVWVFDAAPSPQQRSGQIDVAQAIDWMTGVGVNPTGTVVTFEATRVGD